MYSLINVRMGSLDLVIDMPCGYHPVHDEDGRQRYTHLYISLLYGTYDRDRPELCGSPLGSLIVEPRQSWWKSACIKCIKMLY